MTGYGVMCFVGVAMLFVVACSHPGIGPEMFDASFVLQYGLNTNGLGIPDHLIPILLLVPT